jgi:hypothetical protein
MVFILKKNSWFVKGAVLQNDSIGSREVTPLCRLTTEGNPKNPSRME